MTLSWNVVLATPLAGQTQGGVLASLPGSTRSAGLGGAGAALVGDAGAVFSNPAGIATIRHLSLEGAYQHGADGTAFGSGALALRAGRLSWGFGAAALDTAGALYRARDVLGVAALVFRASFIALGTSIKYVREGQASGSSTADAWAGDAGLAIALFDIMALGVSVQNIGGDFGTGGAHLPRRTRAGFTLNYVDPQGTYRLLTTVEGQWPDAGAAFVVVGVEGGVVTRGVGLIGRTGYAGRSGAGGAGGAGAASPFSFGGSVELGRLHLDYAYRALDPPAGDTHRFGLRWTP